MASDIDLLIDHYQWEIVRLKNSIKENLEMHFYREVEFDERALGESQRELDRLLELKNPNYLKIKKLQLQIEMYERMSTNRPDNSDYYQLQISDAKDKLDLISKEVHEPNFFDTQMVDDAIFQLIKGELLSFKLHLDIENGQYLKLHQKEKNKVKIDFFTSEEDFSWFLKYSIFAGLNFSNDFKEKKLSYVFVLESDKNILPLKELLSRIVVGLKTNFRYKNIVHLELIKE